MALANRRLQPVSALQAQCTRRRVFVFQRDHFPVNKIPGMKCFLIAKLDSREVIALLATVAQLAVNFAKPTRRFAKTPSRLKAARNWFYAFFKFSRPHTVLGTFISIVSVSLLALALVPALLMNVHIVGLNQIYDVEIDKVNKPYLPLASGEFSMRAAVTIVTVSGAAALLLGMIAKSPPLMVTLVGSMILGAAYSADVPLLRWKRFPSASAACILAVSGLWICRAVLVQLGFFFHMTRSLGRSQVAVTPPLAFTIAFMLFFATVIALFKDIPDIKGDSQAGVRTFSVQQGSSRIFWTCIALLEVAYGGAVVFGFSSKVLWSRYATVAAHVFMGMLLYSRAKKTDLTSSKSIYSCYMFVWKLFYAEYLFVPLLR